MKTEEQLVELQKRRGNYYDVLNIQRKATKSELICAWKKEGDEWTVKKNKDQHCSETDIIRQGQGLISRAFLILNNKKWRELYNKYLDEEKGFFFDEQSWNYKNDNHYDKAVQEISKLNEIDEKIQKQLVSVEKDFFQVEVTTSKKIQENLKNDKDFLFSDKNNNEKKLIEYELLPTASEKEMLKEEDNILEQIEFSPLLTSTPKIGKGKTSRERLEIEKRKAEIISKKRIEILSRVCYKPFRKIRVKTRDFTQKEKRGELLVEETTVTQVREILPLISNQHREHQHAVRSITPINSFLKSFFFLLIIVFITTIANFITTFIRGLI